MPKFSLRRKQPAVMGPLILCPHTAYHAVRLEWLGAQIVVCPACTAALNGQLTAWLAEHRPSAALFVVREDDDGTRTAP